MNLNKTKFESDQFFAMQHLMIRNTSACLRNQGVQRMRGIHGKRAKNKPDLQQPNVGDIQSYCYKGTSGLLHEAIRRRERLRIECASRIISDAAPHPLVLGSNINVDAPSASKGVPVFGMMHRRMSRRRIVPQFRRITVGRMLTSFVAVIEGNSIGRGARKGMTGMLEPKTWGLC